jgi:gamma-glutamyl-gamma-aminobutyrate hydrolase PuuD
VDGAFRPRIVITVASPATQSEPDIQTRKNLLYADAIRRAGGEPRLLDAGASTAERDGAMADMAGLVLSGGADIDPARYGAPFAGATATEPDRDGLEAAAFDAAESRGLPVLGICRGFQAVNVFRGGRLLQHVEGHAGPGYGHGPAARHGLRVDPASRLAGWLGLAGTGEAAGDPLEVNSFHHQAVRPVDLAPGLRPTGWADSSLGELVEAFEDPGGRFVVGVQCHPERRESTPPAFEGLWRAFVDACRPIDGAGEPG